MSKEELPRQWLRPVVEYGPIAAFFVAYYTVDLFTATASIMVASVLAVILSYAVERQIPMMSLITAGIVGVFGGLTLWLQDETFIKMKPTIIQLIFGSVLIGGLMANRLFLKPLMQSALRITDKGWRVLTVRFALFLVLSAILNEVIWRTQSTDLWVNFKVFGLPGLILIFIVIQVPLMKRFTLESKSEINTH
ncbi:MAG: septation protein A [Rhodospirillales bacterium]|jgi:intracellular septation protein|nr:septation protein A [Rhodospirillales bacterium]